MSEDQARVNIRPVTTVLGVAGLLLVAALFLLWPRSPAPPDINGAVLPKPVSLDAVRLQDHRGEPYTSRDLQGQWHLITYGFTYCPDICPTTLSEVSQFKQALHGTSRFQDLQVLFYSVDPQRDSAQQLTDYLSWFDADFIGLRPPDSEAAQHFEQKLGINARILGDADATDYQVAHGMMLYLLDEQGRLRAALAPVSERDGRKYFDPQLLLEDYLALRAWDASQG